MHVSTTHKRGIAAVMAMFFLVLGVMFSAMMFSEITTAVSLTRNTNAGARAMMSAESGLAYMKLKLHDVCANNRIAGNTTPDILYNLGLAMRDSSVGSSTIFPANSVVAPTDPANPVVKVNAIPVPEGQFTSALTLIPDPNDTSKFLGVRLSVTGTNGEASRTLGIDLTAIGGRTPSWTEFPMISRDAMSLPTSSTSGVFAWDADNNIASSDTGVADAFSYGTQQTGYALLFDGMEAPDDLAFPDTYLSDQLHAKLVSMKGDGLSKYASGSKLNNVYIPPNTNPDLSKGTTTLSGIIYVEWPNSITLGSNVVLNGVIVYQKRPKGWTTNGAWPVIDVHRTINLSRDSAAAEKNVTDAFKKSGLDPDAAAEYSDIMKPWAIQAPDADWNPSEGSTTGKVDFWGSIHIRNLLKGAGGGAGSADNYCFHGTIVCEGGVDLRGNRKFSVDPRPNPDLDGAVAASAKLTAQDASYWEN